MKNVFSKTRKYVGGKFLNIGRVTKLVRVKRKKPVSRKRKKQKIKPLKLASFKERKKGCLALKFNGQTINVPLNLKGWNLQEVYLTPNNELIVFRNYREILHVNLMQKTQSGWVELEEGVGKFFTIKKNRRSDFMKNRL